LKKFHLKYMRMSIEYDTISKIIFGGVMKFLVFLLFSFVSAQAIITIAPVDIGQKPGKSGMFKGSFETKRGNSDVDTYSAGLRLQYDNNESYLIWSDFTFSYGKSSGVTNTNKTYAHLRYIHHLYEKSIDWETFLQSETNEFTNVKHRYLGGGGVRFFAKKKHFGKLHLGVGAFYEDISYTTTIDPTEKNLRANTYLAYTNNFTKESYLSYVFYYQPKVDAFEDYILSNGLELNILIYKQFYLNFVFFYDYDSMPAIGVKKEDISQKTSFLYKF